MSAWYWCRVCGWTHISESKCQCQRVWASDWQVQMIERDDRADLAMALELAQLIHDEIGGDYWADNGYNGFGKIADWLRTEVRNALLERAS